MTVVLVHGMPEVDAVWDLVAPRLVLAGYSDQVRLSPPGFGAPVPDGFGATVLEYRDWLVGELERIVAQRGPVDLIGHDWGGNHVVNVAMIRPNLLRSWVSDTVGSFEPDYVWHPLAVQWQTPDEGEARIAEMLASTPGERAERFLAAGMDPVIAATLGAAFDETMAGVILPLYRSAAQPVMADLGRNLAAASARPGLLILAPDDPTSGPEASRRRAAARAGARVITLDGHSHWWMTEGDGRAGGDALIAFLDDSSPH